MSALPTATCPTAVSSALSSAEPLLCAGTPAHASLTPSPNSAVQAIPAAEATASASSTRLLAGIGLAVLAVACFAVLDTSTKVAVMAVPILMGIWFRYIFQSVLTTAFLLPRHGRQLLRTAHPRYQLLRGMLLLACSILAFLSLQYLPMAEFTAILLVAPLAVTLLAATVLKERVSRLRWSLVVGGFMGTLLILRPGGGAFSWASIFPILLVLCNAWFQILTSRLAQTENPLTLHFYTGWIGTLLTTLTLPWVWQSLPSWHWWALLSLMGAMASIGHFLLILAYQRAPASAVTPYLYAQIGFAMIGGWLVFDQVPDLIALLGIGLIALCGAASAWLSMRERRVPATVPSAAKV